MNSLKNKTKRKYTKRNFKNQMPSVLKDFYVTNRYEDFSKTFPTKTIDETVNYFFYNYEFSKQTAWFQKTTFVSALTKIRKTINYYGKQDFYRYIEIFHQLNSHLDKTKYTTELMKYITEISRYIDETIFEELDESQLVYSEEYIYPDLLLTTNHPRLFNLIRNYLKYGFNYLESRTLESINYINSRSHFLKAFKHGYMPVNMLEISYF